MAFEKLKAHPLYKEIHDRVVAGIPCEKIAPWLHEQGAFTDLKEASLVRSLHRYKASLPPTEHPGTAAQNFVQKKLDGFKAGVSEVEELEKLYQLQLSRISLGMEKENTIQFLNKAVRPEIELASNILQKMAELKIKLGILKAVPVGVDVNLNGSVETRATHFFAGKSEGEKEKMGEFAAKLLGVLTKVPQLPAPAPPETPPEPPLEAEFEVLETQAEPPRA
jgi:hypothetical protein